MPLTAGAVLALLAAVTFGATACSAAPVRHDLPAPVRLGPRTRLPASATSILAGPPEVIAEDVPQSLFASAPGVVVAGPSPQADAAAARCALHPRTRRFW